MKMQWIDNYGLDFVWKRLVIRTRTDMSNGKCSKSWPGEEWISVDQ